MTAVSTRVRRIIVEDLELAGDPAELADDYDLLEGGVLDSLAIMELVDHLEDAFDIAIDVDDVMVDRFETIESIAQLVGTKQAS